MASLVGDVSLDGIHGRMACVYCDKHLVPVRSLLITVMWSNDFKTPQAESCCPEYLVGKSLFGFGSKELLAGS